MSETCECNRVGIDDWEPSPECPMHGEDTGEITMTAAEYAAFRERAHSAFRTPGWESPELRVLGPEA